MLVPSQDIVLGCYYLTIDSLTKKGPEATLRKGTESILKKHMTEHAT
jgi:DNA-directed RNA polymerase beta' subunit